MRNILFRADSSSTIGTGHIMRDLVLAKRYERDHIVFAAQALEGNINHRIKEADYTLEVLSSNALAELIELIQKHSIEMIVIDHYGIDVAYEKQLKKQTGITVMVLDDTYEQHHCDILLNHNIYAQAKRYQGLVPSHCELQCGRAYTLIRDEFTVAKAKKKPLEETPIILLVVMGGSDPKGFNIPILKLLETFDQIHTHVVTTTANAHVKVLEAYVANNDKATLHINSQQIAKLMAESHMAILTPSVTLNEAYFMELPFIAIQTADNQKEMVAFLEKNDYPVLKEFDAKKLYDTLEKLMRSYHAEQTH